MDGMIKLYCSACGAPLNPIEGIEQLSCEYCNSIWLIVDADKQRTVKLSDEVKDLKELIDFELAKEGLDYKKKIKLLKDKISQFENDKKKIMDSSTKPNPESVALEDKRMKHTGTGCCLGILAVGIIIILGSIIGYKTVYAQYTITAVSIIAFAYIVFANMPVDNEPKVGFLDPVIIRVNQKRIFEINDLIAIVKEYIVKVNKEYSKPAMLDMSEQKFDVCLEDSGERKDNVAKAISGADPAITSGEASELSEYAPVLLKVNSLIEEANKIKAKVEAAGGKVNLIEF